MEALVEAVEELDTELDTEEEAEPDGLPLPEPDDVSLRVPAGVKDSIDGSAVVLGDTVRDVDTVTVLETNGDADEERVAFIVIVPEGEPVLDLETDALRVTVFDTEEVLDTVVVDVPEAVVVPERLEETEAVPVTVEELVLEEVEERVVVRVTLGELELVLDEVIEPEARPDFDTVIDILCVGVPEEVLEPREDTVPDTLLVLVRLEEAVVV